MSLRQKVILFLIRHFGLSIARLVPHELLTVVEELGNEADKELKARSVR
jgi:hypothetical protein